MKFPVPFDFTPITRTALRHALSLREIPGGTIELLHVVAKSSHEEKALNALQKEVEALDPADQKDVKARVQSR